MPPGRILATVTMIIDADAGNSAPDAGSDDDHRLDAADAGRGDTPHPTQIYYTAATSLWPMPVAMIIIAGTGIDAGMMIVTVATMHSTRRAFLYSPEC